MKTTPSKFKPFFLVTNDENQVVIVAGNVQCSPMTFESEEQAEKYLSEQPYEMFTNLYSIFRYYETKKQDEESTKDNK